MSTAGANLHFESRPKRDYVPEDAAGPLEVQERWMRFLARNLSCYRLVQSLSTDEGFHISAQSRTSNGITAARVMTKSGRSRLVRGLSEIQGDKSARFVIYMSLRGEFEVSQFGRTEICRPSSLVMLSGTEEVSHSKFGDNDTICFLMPEEFVDQRLADSEAKCARQVDVGEGLGHLVFSTLALFPDDASKMSDEEFEAAGALVGDLVLLALAGRPDISSASQSVRAANLAKVKRTIRKRLGELDLSLEDIALQCGISLSYMHNLFRDNNVSAWEFLKNERLQRARQMMTSPASRAVSVTDIALSCGFSNMSQFSTAFKQAFSLSPRDVLRSRQRASSC